MKLSKQQKNEEGHLVMLYAHRNKLNSTNRARPIHYQRCYLMHYLKDVIGLSNAAVGAVFNRDHATVLNGRKVYRTFKEDALFNRYIEDVKEAFPLNKFDNTEIIEYRIKPIAFTEDNYLAVDRFKILNNHASIDTVLNKLIEMHLKDLKDEQ